MSFALTSRGEQEALKINQVTSPESAVLVYMYEIKRPAEVEDIQEETRMSDEKALKVLRRLENGGYISET